MLNSRNFWIGLFNLVVAAVILGLIPDAVGVVIAIVNIVVGILNIYIAFAEEA